MKQDTQPSTAESCSGLQRLGYTSTQGNRNRTACRERAEPEWFNCRSTFENVARIARRAGLGRIGVAQYEQVAYFGSLECEDRHARPQNMLPAGRHAEQFLAMEAVESHLAVDAVAFLEHHQDVGGVLAERAGYPVDIFRELVMADERCS